MAMKSRYETYARKYIAKKNQNIAKQNGVKTSVLEELRNKKEQTTKVAMM